VQFKQQKSEIWSYTNLLQSSAVHKGTKLITMRLTAS
jgi:hypothetical protein